jgi:hypothetical protein
MINFEYGMQSFDAVYAYQWIQIFWRSKLPFSFSQGHSVYIMIGQVTRAGLQGRAMGESKVIEPYPG